MIQFLTKCKTAVLGLSSLLVLSSFALDAKESPLSLMSESQTPTPSGVSFEQTTKHLQAAAKKNNSKNQVSNSWKPYFTRNSSFECIPNVTTNMNIGIGFLYFNGRKGGGPSDLGDTSLLRTSQMQTPIVYNRSPLIEANATWNFAGVSRALSFLGVGLSYINQSNVYFQAYQVARVAPSVIGVNPFTSTFTATLNLTAIAAKFSFYLPYSMIWKTISYSPYAALSVGPAWQTWGDIKLYKLRDSSYTMNLTQKVSANCFFGSEVGLKLRSLIPNINFSVLLGCKFNLWGQARYMGKASQQKMKGTGANTPISRAYALTYPAGFKMIHQWSPYLGFMWSF